MKEIPLKAIDYVLLDLDGTLLDKYFDDYFWEHLVPEKYAEKHDISFGRAKELLYEKYKNNEKTLNWTDLDYWSREFNLDIAALKEQTRHLIDVHPHVVEFLVKMRQDGRKVHLLTNAHMKAVEIKFKKTGIGKYFDHVIAAHDTGHPKEEPGFWHSAQKALGFDPLRSLFVDDVEDILFVARDYGIKYLVHKGRSSSKKADEHSEHFPSIKDFRELMD